MDNPVFDGRFNNSNVGWVLNFWPMLNQSHMSREHLYLEYGLQTIRALFIVFNALRKKLVSIVPCSGRKGKNSRAFVNQERALLCYYRVWRDEIVVRWCPLQVK